MMKPVAGRVKLPSRTVVRWFSCEETAASEQTGGDSVGGFSTEWLTVRLSARN